MTDMIPLKLVVEKCMHELPVALQQLASLQLGTLKHHVVLPDAMPQCQCLAVINSWLQAGLF